MKFFAATLSLSLALFAPADAANGCRALTRAELDAIPSNAGESTNGDCERCQPHPYGKEQSWYPCKGNSEGVPLCTPGCFGSTPPPVPSPTYAPTDKKVDRRCKKINKLLKKTKFWEINTETPVILGSGRSIGDNIFINGDVFSDTELWKRSGTYNQMCALAKNDVWTGFIENFCEYNFCLNIDKNNKGCIMLRSGGPYEFVIPTEDGTPAVPDIDTFVYGGTGCFKGIQGSALIESGGTSCDGADCPQMPDDTVVLKLTLEHVMSSDTMLV